MTRRIPSFVALLAVTATVAGCGSSSPDKAAAPAKAAAPCGLLANGEKVCGEDLKTYCDGFADTAEAETKRACDQVNPDAQPPGAAGCTPGDKSPGCTVNEDNP